MKTNLMMTFFRTLARRIKFSENALNYSISDSANGKFIHAPLQTSKCSCPIVSVFSPLQKVIRKHPRFSPPPKRQSPPWKITRKECAAVAIVLKHPLTKRRYVVSPLCSFSKEYTPQIRPREHKAPAIPICIIKCDSLCNTLNIMCKKSTLGIGARNRRL